MDSTLVQVLDSLDTTLISMKGIDTVSASRLLSAIGDVRCFANPSPVAYASGKNDKQYANQCGNRELNSLFYNLALHVSICKPVCVSC